MLRVEASTSDVLNREVPAHKPPLQPAPLVRDRLSRLGHCMFMYWNKGGLRKHNMCSKTACSDGENPGGLSAIGLGCAKGGLPPNGADGDFVRYTLPALEVRTMLIEMRRREEAFRLEYTRIAGPVPWGIDAAERWRIDGCGVRVHLREDGRGARTCLWVDTCDGSVLPESPASAINRLVGRSRRCAADEIAMMDAEPGPLAATLLYSNRTSPPSTRRAARPSAGDDTDTFAHRTIAYPIGHWPSGEVIYGRLCGTKG